MSSLPLRKIFSALVVGCFLTAGFAHAASVPAAEKGAPVAVKPEAVDSGSSGFFDRIDYGGNLWDRPALTGNWGDLRQKLMDRGVKISSGLTQTMQGNSSGGTERKLMYTGLLDYGIEFDTEKMGLWPGGYLKIRGKTQYGHSDNSIAGSLSPVNAANVLPFLDQAQTALTEFYAMQFLTKWFGVMAGRIEPRDANIFAHDEREQFMNMAFVINPMFATTVPPCVNMVGNILAPAKWFNLKTMLLDSEGNAVKVGINTLFERGTSLVQVGEFAVKPFGLEGHQRLGWTWSNKKRFQMRQDIRQILIDKLVLNTDPQLKQSQRDWLIFYDFDQYLYRIKGAKDRGFGVFGRFGYTNSLVSPFRSFYEVGFSAKGIIPCRARDGAGVGYYFLEISHKIPEVIRKRTHAEQGVEIYYNAALTPWLRVTPDLQIEYSARRKVDTAVVMGLRTQMDF